jgi:hypothetical protein
MCTLLSDTFRLIFVAGELFAINIGQINNKARACGAVESPLGFARMKGHCFIFNGFHQPSAAATETVVAFLKAFSCR